MGTGLVDPLIGHVVDERYQVTVRIARGGMATVYRATDRRLEREVALKVMHPHLIEGTDSVARFRREARSAARLVHPGVVSVFDQGTAGDSPYLVMEFVDGPNLRAHLRAVGSESLGEALATIAQVLDALALAHSQGVVHRDIKPENVLISAGGRVKVADFGLARAISEVTMATTGVVLGTAAYLAPEVVQNGTADARSDVYACGILLYELLTGTRPFDGTNAVQVAYRHIHEDVPPPSRIEPWIPAEVDQLVAAMTRRDPAGRPADAGAALELVRRVRRGLSPEQLQQRGHSVPARNAALVPDATEALFADVDAAWGDADHTEVLATDEAAFGTGGSTVALPVGHEVFDLGEPMPGDQVAKAPRVRKRRRTPWKAITAVLVLLLVGGGAAATFWYFNSGPGSLTQVPGIVGLAEQTAISKLREAQLGDTIDRQFSDTVDEGVVISAQPAPGERTKKNGRVALVISRGIETHAVPKVVGLTENEAIARLQQVGLTNGPSKYVYSSKVSIGFVISLSPKAGTTIAHNKPVTLTISKGPQPVKMPKLTGLGADAAAQQIDDLSLSATVTQENSATVPAGVVISQSPKPGTTLHRGDNVAYVLSLGPKQVAVPDVTQRNVDDATQILSGLGFQVQIVKPQQIAPLNTVYEQSPAAGNLANEGATVTLSVF